MKTIVAGSREGFVARNVFEAIEESQFNITEIVSGGARGVDRDGEYYATVNKIPLTVFYADWNKHPKAGGILRNIKMAEYADALVAVWDGKSRGTKHMIETMKAMNKPVYVYIR